jgi:aminocarboxymuconate-semialdehyde decarboxylase
MGKFIEEMGLDAAILEDIFCKASLEWLDIPKERFN